MCRQLQSELATAQQELAEGELRATQLEGHWRSEVEALKETAKASALQCTALQNQLNGEYITVMADTFLYTMQKKKLANVSVYSTATRQELKDSLSSAAAERKHASAMAERVRSAVCSTHMACWPMHV